MIASLFLRMLLKAGELWSGHVLNSSLEGDDRGDEFRDAGD